MCEFIVMHSVTFDSFEWNEWRVNGVVLHKPDCSCASVREDLKERLSWNRPSPLRCHVELQEQLRFAIEMTLNSVLQVLLSQRYHNSSEPASLRSILRLASAQVCNSIAILKRFGDVRLALLTYVGKPIEPYHFATNLSNSTDEFLLLLSRTYVVESQRINNTQSANLSSTNSVIGFNHIDQHNQYFHPQSPT